MFYGFRDDALTYFWRLFKRVKTLKSVLELQHQCFPAKSNTSENRTFFLHRLLRALSIPSAFQVLIVLGSYVQLHFGSTGPLWGQPQAKRHLESSRSFFPTILVLFGPQWSAKKARKHASPFGGCSQGFWRPHGNNVGGSSTAPVVLATIIRFPVFGFRSLML